MSDYLPYSAADFAADIVHEIKLWFEGVEVNEVTIQDRWAEYEVTSKDKRYLLLVQDVTREPSP